MEERLLRNLLNSEIKSIGCVGNRTTIPHS